MKMSDGGFTFIEVLLVIVILGLLSWIVWPYAKKTFDEYEFSTYEFSEISRIE